MYFLFQILDNPFIFADPADYHNRLKQFYTVKKCVADIPGNPVTKAGSDCRQTISLLLHVHQIRLGKNRTARSYFGRYSMIALSKFAQLGASGESKPCGLLI